MVNSDCIKKRSITPVKMMQAEDGSINQLKAQLSLLTAQYNALTEAEREDTAAGMELTANILAITEKLKQEEKALGGYKA